MTVLTPNYVQQHNGGIGGVAVPMFPRPIAEQPKDGPLKVALIGTAPSSRMLAPYNDPSWKIWACSPGNMNVLPRVDLWFELHGNMNWPECASYGMPYVEWLKKQSFPIYMQNQRFVPNALTFPMVKMVREFGQDFFTSSFAWMMAFAISEGAKEISLYGIDMASRDEYVTQRQSFYYFRQIACQRGIVVGAPAESDIMQSPGLYGYSEIQPAGRKWHARKTEIVTRVNAMEAEREKLVNNITYLKGADEDIDYFLTIWIGLTNEIALLSAELEDMKKENAGLRKQIDDMKKENAGLRKQIDDMTPNPMETPMEPLTLEEMRAAE